MRPEQEAQGAFEHCVGAGTLHWRRKGAAAEIENSQSCRLFIGGLKEQMNEAGLRRHFQAFSTVRDYEVMVNHWTKRSRCFGFVTYSNMAEANATMAASPHAVEDTMIELKWAMPRVPRDHAHNQVKKLVVRGLKGIVIEGDVVRHFSQLGEVEKAEILVDKRSGKKRSPSLVYFRSCDAANRATVFKFHPIGSHCVEMRKAVTKKALRRCGGGRGGSDRPSRGSRHNGGLPRGRDDNRLSTTGGCYNSYGSCEESYSDYGGGYGSTYSHWFTAIAAVRIPTEGTEEAMVAATNRAP
ncbi:heterogeneous nuclear ribonucleoprotein A0-like [Notamacropus eugenii]|uniref:heterogeneous nuclear ribonucleoprotein A0-like n=1 Tax=Notamacropus eugenii TaxID=9315 RepID=UPI003B680B4D